MKLKNILIIILGLFLSSFFVLGAVPENSFLGDLNSYFAGNLWIGTDSASETFYVEGDGKVNGAFTSNTLNTGQGDNELYAMNQNLETTDSPTFAGGTFNGDLDISDNNLDDVASIDGGGDAVKFDDNVKIKGDITAG